MTDFAGLVDLADRRLGAGVVAANDEFFAEKENLLKRSAPVFDPYSFTHRGKLMDGWETRRRRDVGDGDGAAGAGASVGGSEPGGPGVHDWAIVRLGAPGIVRGVLVDTAHFMGNYPETCSVEACAVDGFPSPAEVAGAVWHQIMPPSPVQADAEHRFAVTDEHRWTHVRLSIYPDGGVARLRVYGDVVADPRLLDGRPLDLASIEAGGRPIDCSDRFYSDPANLLMPGSPANMGDGWETKRRRGPGNDWALLRLGAQGVVRQVVVDTTHFKGNAPARCRITGTAEPSADPVGWAEVLPLTALQPDTVHRFPAAPAGSVTQVRIDIYPDGGLARLRLFGDLDPVGRQAVGLAWLNALPAEQAERVLLGCNAAPAWAHAMTAGRPYGDREAVSRAAERAADGLDRDGWLVAFDAHPRIGARGKLSLRSRREQAGASTATEAALAALTEGNHAYEERFGHVFLICASGRSADEMVTALRERINNDADTELAIAIAEHRKITALRLESLVG